MLILGSVVICHFRKKYQNTSTVIDSASHYRKVYNYMVKFGIPGRINRNSSGPLLKTCQLEISVAPSVTHGFPRYRFTPLHRCAANGSKHLFRKIHRTQTNPRQAKATLPETNIASENRPGFSLPENSCTCL